MASRRRAAEEGLEEVGVRIVPFVGRVEGVAAGAVAFGGVPAVEVVRVEGCAAAGSCAAAAAPGLVNCSSPVKPASR